MDPRKFRKTKSNTAAYKQFVRTKYKAKKYVCKYVGTLNCANYTACSWCTKEWLAAPWCENFSKTP